MKRSARCLLAWSAIAGAMLFLLLLFAQAQQPGTPPASTFSSNAELVLVPVSVRDHYGQPLAGFQQSDFKLTDNGKQATIAVFEEVHANQAPQPLPSQDKQTYSNMVASPDSGSARSREPLILLMDGINSPLASQARAGKGLVECKCQRKHMVDRLNPQPV